MQVDSSVVPHLFQEALYHFTSPAVVVLRREWVEYSEGERQLLQKILTSVHVDMNAALMLARPVLDFDELNIHAPSHVFVFGSQLPADVQKYQPQKAHGFDVIAADDLDALVDQKKKDLWAALKQMFSV